MQIKAFTLLSLTALVLAAPDKVRRQQSASSDLSALASLAGVTSLPTDSAVLSSLETVAASINNLLPPASILSVLQTGVPSSVISDLADPAKASAFASAFQAGSTPAWYSSLPAGVKSYLSTYTAGAEATSLSSAAGLATSAASSIINSANSAASSASSSASAQATNAAGSSSSSTGGAPRATGVIAAGIAGAIGVLGVAIAL